MVASGQWHTQRQSNIFDGSAPFYATYETSDGGHVAVGALEPQFYAALLNGLELEASSLPEQYDREGWSILGEVFADKFRQRTRDSWDRHFAGTDACVVPVLSMIESSSHPHNEARSVFVDIDGVGQPGPSPRFSETVSGLPGSPSVPGADTDIIMKSLGYNANQIGMLRTSETIA
jgi:alpha-methylacyl-CoA racemase